VKAFDRLADKAISWIAGGGGRAALKPT
jgi:hypothetical protein